MSKIFDRFGEASTYASLGGAITAVGTYMTGNISMEAMLFAVFSAVIGIVVPEARRND